MKFNNGYWMLREGVQQLAAKQVYSYQISEDCLTLYAPTAVVTGKGRTLNQPMLTISITSPVENVLRIQSVHHKGGLKNNPGFALAQQSPAVTITEEPGKVLFRSGKTVAEVATEGAFSIGYYYDGCLMTSTGNNSNSYMLDGGTAYYKEELALDVGELVYGLGERFTAFTKNGQSIDIWNEDGGTCSEQTYKNIPFYLTNKGYGVLVNHPERVSFEIASEKVNRIQFSVPGEGLDYCIFGANDPKTALIRYTDLTGKPDLPPAWSFGLWLSTSFLTEYSEETFMNFIDGMQQRGIPLDVFHFDCCWMEEFEWCNFQWNAKWFPDPAAMLQKIHDRGLKVCVWINSYIAQKSPLFDEGLARGYFVKNPDGTVWQWDLWQAGMALVDFTNPEATAWYTDKLEALLDMGVDCFKTDFGERIPTDVIWHDGSDPAKMHNYYAFLYNEAVYNLLKRKRGEGEAVVFARSATVGGQQFPVHWGGDCTSQYTSMAETLRGGLSFTLSGFGFWSHDIGGFEDGCTPDIYKRWTQFGLLSTHSRYHSSGEYKVPWIYDEEAVDVTRTYTQLKADLMPYLFACAMETHETGIPMMRAMLLEFLADETCHTLDRQYMLGANLLVAPIFNDRGEVSYYLPAGSWTHLLTGTVYEGGKWYKEQYDYLSMPVFVRENSILVTGSGQKKASYDYTDHVTVQLYGFSGDCTVSQKVYDCAGQLAAVVTVFATQGSVAVDTDKLTNVTVLLNGKPL